MWDNTHWIPLHRKCASKWHFLMRSYCLTCVHRSSTVLSILLNKKVRSWGIFWALKPTSINRADHLLDIQVFKFGTHQYKPLLLISQRRLDGTHFHNLLRFPVVAHATFAPTSLVVIVGEPLVWCLAPNACKRKQMSQAFWCHSAVFFLMLGVGVPLDSPDCNMFGVHRRFLKAQSVCTSLLAKRWFGD